MISLKLEGWAELAEQMDASPPGRRSTPENLVLMYAKIEAFIEIGQPVEEISKAVRYWNLYAEECGYSARIRELVKQ